MSYLNDPSQIPHVDASPAGRPYAALSPHLPGMQVMAGFGQTRRFEGTLPDLSSYFNHNQGPYHPGRSNITFQLPGPGQNPLGDYGIEINIPEIPGGTDGIVDHYFGQLSGSGADGSKTIGGIDVKGRLYAATVIRIRTTRDSGGNESIAQSSEGLKSVLVANVHVANNTTIPSVSDIAYSVLASKISTDPATSIQAVPSKSGLIIPLIKLGTQTASVDEYLGFSAIPFLKTECA